VLFIRAAPCGAVVEVLPSPFSLPARIIDHRENTVVCRK